MKLRIELCGKSKIKCWANQYKVANDTCIETLVPEVKDREPRCLTKLELIEVSNWVLQKNPEGLRQYRVGLVKQNSSDDVREITRDAFLSTNDSDSIRCLRRLDGVRWAIGSAILHWFHERPYPTWTPHGKWGFCLDPKLKWNSTDWQKYVKCFRNALDKYEVCKRTLDRACREFGKAKMP